MELCKVYIQGWRRREKPEWHVCDFFFCSADKAGTWHTQAEADTECAFLETLDIEIALREGGKFICRGFQSEPRPNGEFVISCKIPPVSLQAVQPAPPALKSFATTVS
jgi:hypothetical protein